MSSNTTNANKKIKKAGAQTEKRLLLVYTNEDADLTVMHCPREHKSAVLILQQLKAATAIDKKDPDADAHVKMVLAFDLWLQGEDWSTDYAGTEFSEQLKLLSDALDHDDRKAWTVLNNGGNSLHMDKSHLFEVVFLEEPF